MARLDEAHIGSWIDPTDKRPFTSVSRALGGEDSDSVLVVFYRLRCDALDAECDKESLLRWVGAELLPVQHAFVVVGEVWWAFECALGCCDGSLQELPQLDRDVVARAVGKVQRPACSREAALAALARRDPERIAAVVAAAEGMPLLTRRAAAAEWEMFVASVHPSVETVGCLVSALEHPVLRDEFLRRLLPEMTRVSSAAAGTKDAHPAGAEERASQTARSLETTLPTIPTPARAHWLAYLALARWRSGDGSGAGLAAEQALHEGAEVPLVRTVAGLVSSGARHTDAQLLFGRERRPTSTDQDVDVLPRSCGGDGLSFVA